MLFLFYQTYFGGDFLLVFPLEKLNIRQKPAST
jgi:hypothetical protein